MSTELAIIENLNSIPALDVFKPEKVDDILKRIQEEADKFEADPTTDKGREEIASFCYKIRRSKTAIDDLGKNLVSDWKTQAKAVDVERKRVRDTLDALVESLYKPVQEHKDREAARVQNHERALEDLAAFKNFSLYDGNGQPPTSALIDAKRKESRAFFQGREWEEYLEQAAAQDKENTETLDEAFERVKKQEEDQAELDRLREKEAEAERDKERQQAHTGRIERIDALVDDLLDDPTITSGQIAFKIKEVQSETYDYEEFADRAQIVKERTIKKLEEIKAEREAKERESIAEQERKKIADQQAADAKAEEEAQALREKNTRHKGKINGEARDDIMLALGDGYSEEDAKKLVVAIAQGKIRHVSIKY